MCVLILESKSVNCEDKETTSKGSQRQPFLNYDQGNGHNLSAMHVNCSDTIRKIDCSREHGREQLPSYSSYSCDHKP